MMRSGAVKGVGYLALVALFAVSGAVVAQNTQPTNNLPNPYVSFASWAQLPPGRSWGSTAGVDIDPDGKSVWAIDRCGANSCEGSNLDPILKFDSTGKLVRSFGAGLFLFPHGISVDREGNVWVTDGQGKGGKGHQVIKFSPTGQVLMRLGTAGIPGNTPVTFNAPSDVLVAPNGDVFVGDGHGKETNARIVKFDKAGKYIKEWGVKGTGPGQFDTPHALAMDSKGRLFVGDRNNNRIQIFDQDGKFIDAWSQFSRPSGIHIDKNDVLYVTDSESESVAKNHDGWKRGIRIGSAKDGKVLYLIPDPDNVTKGSSAAEGVAADDKGVIYGAEVGPKRLMRYTKK